MDISERTMECYNLGLNVKYLYHQMVASVKKKKTVRRKMFLFFPQKGCEFAEWFFKYAFFLLDHPLCPVFKPRIPTLLPGHQNSVPTQFLSLFSKCFYPGY